MCYNISYLERKQKKYYERYKNLDPPDWSKNVVLFNDMGLPDYSQYFISGFSYPKMPLITEEKVVYYDWGLIPFFCKDEKYANEIRMKTLNAVGETVFERPSFRSVIKKNRALLPITGFFEWRDYKNKKYPYYIRTSDEEMFALAVIYDSWTNKETGEIRNTFSILTTSANPLMEKIHNIKKRMPLIIPREKEEQWIDTKLNEDQIQKLIIPFDEKLMSAHTVSQKINSTKNNRNIPETIEEVSYPELENGEPTLFG